MEDINKQDSYFNDVIKRWDEASGVFLAACEDGNQSSMAYQLNILNPDGSVEIDKNPSNSFELRKIRAVKETIDGVGTKVQIYTNQFENIFQSREKKEIEGEEAKKQATELWERMLMDLIAMNSDDLRWGELAIGATNIIDINHLTGMRGHLFQDSMADAMKKTIQATGIAMTAGETAVLGISPEAAKIYLLAERMIADINDIIARDNHDSTFESWSTNACIKEIIDIFDDKAKMKLEEISFNIWWTCLWLATIHDKLIPLKDGQVIIGFQEIPANGIIWPRSNGITKIRDDMKTIMGDWRENTTFEDLLEKIWAEKSEKIPDNVKTVCAGKKMRDIATGKTTVFNPFVADILLGGIRSQPEVWISKIIHVTGNPLKKISEWINKDKENIHIINLDLFDMPSPQIITLLQAALDIPDEIAMNKWNMGVPYAIVCDKGDYETIINTAEIHGITAKVIGTVQEPIDKWANTIIGVGLNKSNMTF